MTTRRTFLKSSFAATIVTGTAMSQETGNVPETKAPTPRKGRIRQSVSRWCYKNIPLDQLCQASAQMGLKAVDLLEISEWDVPRRYGLICSMGYAGGGTIPDALNRTENHAAIEEAFRKNIPLAAKAGVPNVITFSGNRKGMPDDEGARNCVIGLNRLKKIAEDNGVNICMELLNSKHDHHDYMCDHTAGACASSVKSTHRASSCSRHITCRSWKGPHHHHPQNIQWLGPSTGGSRRHELDNTQEVRWTASCENRRPQLQRLRRPRVRPRATPHLAAPGRRSRDV